MTSSSVDKQKRYGETEYDFIEEDSDHECGNDSSDDELEILLHGTSKQKQRLTRSISRGSLEMSSSSSEDEFEKEMEEELDEAMKQYEQQQFSTAAAASSHISGASGELNGQGGGGASQSTGTDANFYEDVYFDSDEEGDATRPEKKKQTRHKHRVLTNDELLYDPDIDDQNEAWVNKQRERYYPSSRSQSSAEGTSGSDVGESGGETKEKPLPKSDAVLNCPACLTTLCLDCQHHELYQHQYRAMFVLNCSIVRTERLKYTAPPKRSRGGKWRKKPKLHMERADLVPGSEVDQLDKEECFHPVRCSQCNTEVAVYDSDEVFHFFNVLSSLP